MLQQKVTDYFTTLSQLLLAIEATDKLGGVLPLEQGAERAVQMIMTAKTESRKVLLAGNGGSSSIASHVQNDLCKSVGVRAMVFTEQPLLTALANDDGYGSVYEWPISLWAEEDDLLVTVSSSGQSENIVRALAAGQEKGCQLITLSGFDPDNASRAMGDINFYVPSDVYGFVESAHTALAHYLANMAASW